MKTFTEESARPFLEKLKGWHFKENAIEKDIDENSLAYKLGSKGKVKISNYGQIIFGAFDVLLEKRKKGTDVFCGYSLATEDEISKIK